MQIHRPVSTQRVIVVIVSENLRRHTSSKNLCQKPLAQVMPPPWPLLLLRQWADPSGGHKLKEVRSVQEDSWASVIGLQTSYDAVRNKYKTTWKDTQEPPDIWWGQQGKA